MGRRKNFSSLSQAWSLVCYHFTTVELILLNAAAHRRRRAQQAEGRRRLPENDLNDGPRRGPGAQVPPPPLEPRVCRAGQQDGLPEPLDGLQPEPGTLHLRDPASGVDDLGDGAEQHRRRDPHRERQRHRQMSFLRRDGGGKVHIL